MDPENRRAPERQSTPEIDYGDQVDYLRVVVKNLRKKMESVPEHPHYIKTEPWVGYRFDTSPESE